MAGLIIGVQFRCPAADLLGLIVPLLPDEPAGQIPAQLEKSGMVVGPQRHGPGVAGGVGDQIPLIQPYGLHLPLRALLHRLGAGLVEPLNVQHQFDILIPAVDPPAIQDNFLSVGETQIGLHGAPGPVEQGLQGVSGINILHISPKRLNQFLLCDRTLMVNGQIFKKSPEAL